MPITPEESAAAHRVADAVLDLILAVEKGAAARRPPIQSLASAPPPAPRHFGVNAWADAVTSKLSPDEVKPLLVDKLTAASLLGVSAGTVFNMSAPRGPLPCVRFEQGGHAIVRYALKDLEAFIATMTVQGKTGKRQA